MGTIIPTTGTLQRIGRASYLLIPADVLNLAGLSKQPHYRAHASRQGGKVTFTVELWDETDTEGNGGGSTNNQI